MSTEYFLGPTDPSLLPAEARQRLEEERTTLQRVLAVQSRAFERTATRGRLDRIESTLRLDAAARAKAASGQVIAVHVARPARPEFLDPVSPYAAPSAETIAANGARGPERLMVFNGTGQMGGTR
jgi:hypothetical protein